MNTLIRQCMNPFPASCVDVRRDLKWSGVTPYRCGKRRPARTTPSDNRTVVPDSSCPWCVVYYADDQERRAIVASMMNIVASAGYMITGYREKLNETEPDAE